MVKCIDSTVANLEKLDIEPTDIVAIGLASQRCNAIAWDKITGALVYPGCIMAADIRTQPLVDELKKVYSFFECINRGAYCWFLLINNYVLFL